MTIYFVSSADGSDSDNGTTLDLAWATVEHALENGVLTVGDSVAIRRTHSEIPTSDIAPVDDGTISSPIKIFGCPRSAHAISSSDWTNGSTAVTVDDADMAREQHQARYIDAPDGNRYMITRVISTTSIVIDSEYAGSTVSNNATASIQADTTQDDWDNYDDSADTIKKSAWEADADTLPVIDFNDGNFQLYFNADDFYYMYCIEFKDTTDGSGLIRATNVGTHYYEGLLLKQTVADDPCMTITGSSLYIKRSIFEGSGSGASQKGITTLGLAAFYILKDVAMYNLGDSALYTVHDAELYNVNLGVEIANGDADIMASRASFIKGADVKLGGSNGTVAMESAEAIGSYISFENYQKVLGYHRTYYGAGYYERAAISGETPNKKVSDYVVKIVPNVNFVPTFEFSKILSEHEIDGVTTGSKTFKYWIYNDTGTTLNDTTALDNIWLKAEYVDSYDDTSEYTQTEAFSTQIDILDAADADDWDYLEVTLNPATTSKVRLTIYISYYNATTNLFIDPAVVIS